MPLIAALVGALISALGTMVGKVLISLGMGFIVYQGIDTTISFVKNYALSQISSMPSQIVSLMSYLKVGVCINIIFSAMLVRMIFNGLQSDTVKRFVLK